MPESGRIAFHGFTSRADGRVEIQVKLDHRWQTVGTARTEPEPIDPRAVVEMYAWAASIDLGERLEAPPSQGVLRVRALAAGAPLAVMSADDDCAEETAPAGHAAVARQCGFAVTDGAILVDRVPEDLSIGRPVFLDRKGEADALAYYATTGAAATLSEFRTRYGFGTSSEVSAVYYNRGDLAVGREMHCTEFSSAAGTGLACYSSNYGQFSGPARPALDAAIAGYEAGNAIGAFATVAMVYTPPIDRPDAVSFVVFDGRGVRANEAQLDRYGDNVAIPSNCMNCHGSSSVFDPGTSSVRDARFLPFDPAMLEFSDRPAYAAAAQAEKVRALNAMVYRAAPTPSVASFLEGMYPDGVTSANGRAAFTGFVPPGWSQSREDRAVYRNVVAPFCRGCHQTNTGTYAFETAASFREAREEIVTHICGPVRRSMPNAEVVFGELWRSNARAYLVDFLAIEGGCALR